ncbi:hypothetical protein K435DRAFT_809027 [Dendrothele bispora CBS 962.96]|uniref:Uncharacterized protein n=1 Tax=Dendrothele bispora (strain CBS 962.96) TaxID=1314807 RepID=A0A4S8KZX7_DENBC|nr:hypothetical protein K435DRAFT_809027 [Dendrothele bispora CBS 962.96]
MAEPTYLAGVRNSPARVPLDISQGLYFDVGIVWKFYLALKNSILTSDKGHLENHLCLYFCLGFYLNVREYATFSIPFHQILKAKPLSNRFRLWDVLKLQTIVRNPFIPMMVLRVAIDLLICGCLSITLHESRTEIASMAVMGMTVALIVNPRNVGMMTLESVIVHEAISEAELLIDMDVPMSEIQSTIDNNTPLDIVSLPNDAGGSKHSSSKDVGVVITRKVKSINVGSD